MKRLIVAVAVLLLSACSTFTERTVFVEAEHVSHPFSGWPFGPASEEVALTQLSAGFSAQNESGWYVEGALGYNVEGEFYGHPITFTGRVGREFKW